jgi:hypothetical protein
MEVFSKQAFMVINKQIYNYNFRFQSLAFHPPTPSFDKLRAGPRGANSFIN